MTLFCAEFRSGRSGTTRIGSYIKRWGRMRRKPGFTAKFRILRRGGAAVGISGASPEKSFPEFSRIDSFSQPKLYPKGLAYFQNENFRMHYEVHRGLVPVDTLLIHGNLGSSLWWQPSIESWAKRCTERQPGSLIVAEWRGCGKSSGPQSAAELELSVLAEDYIELLMSLGISKARVIGHSLGSLIALHALKQAPDVFDRAILLDPVSEKGVQLTPQIQAAFLEKSRNRDVLKDALSRTIHCCDRSDPFFEKIVDQAFASHPIVWANVLKIISQLDFSAELAGIRQPTLVLHGEHDDLLPIAGAIEIAKGLPEGRFEMLEGQGHSCQIENPDRFVDIAYSYLFG
jgi:3-oxoadipate enol-lactonase